MSGMAALRSPRLQAIFGADLDNVTAEHIRFIVENEVTEDFDLDFKSELYGSSDKAKHDLATDVAALASTAGGVVVLGVTEDEQARATAAPGVTLSDAETSRMRQIIASKVAPMPQFDILKRPRFDAASF